MEEKITLSEEQAKRFITKLNNNIIEGLEELEKILQKELGLKNNWDFNIFDLIHYCYYANSLNIGANNDDQITDFDLCVDIDNIFNKLLKQLLDNFTNDFARIKCD